jgi:hypothetical protein
MQIFLLDDSIPFDGTTPDSLPLAGAEKAFVGMAEGLAARGHAVTAINRCTTAHRHENVRWLPWGHADIAGTAEVVIAYRKPALLAAGPLSDQQIFWPICAADGLALPDVARALDALNPRIMFNSGAQYAAWQGAQDAGIAPPGVRAPFVQDMPAVVPDSPVALCTCHPAHGLMDVLDQWSKNIHPAVPAAQLHIYSVALSKGVAGAALPEPYASILARVQRLADDGVHIFAPGDDATMAAAYRNATIHLHPTHADDMGCWTLAESQATGLPAVALGQGAAEERVINGITGYLVPDLAAMGNMAVHCLSNPEALLSLRQAARAPDRRRTWQHVAMDVEMIIETNGL